MNEVQSGTRSTRIVSSWHTLFWCHEPIPCSDTRRSSTQQQMSTITEAAGPPLYARIHGATGESPPRLCVTWVAVVQSAHPRDCGIDWQGLPSKFSSSFNIQSEHSLKFIYVFHPINTWQTIMYTVATATVTSIIGNPTLQQKGLSVMFCVLRHLEVHAGNSHIGTFVYISLEIFEIGFLFEEYSPTWRAKPNKMQALDICSFRYGADKPRNFGESRIRTNYLTQVRVAPRRLG